MNDSISKHQKFYKLVYGIIFNYIDDNVYLSKVQKLVNDDLHLNDIVNIKKIIYLLKINKKKLAYLFTMLTYSKQCLHKSINEYIIANKNIGLHTHMHNSSKLLDGVIELKKYLLNSISYINAFTPINKLSVIDEQKCVNNNASTEFNHKEEIVERLRLLVKYYNLHTLKYYNVKILNVNHVETLSYNELTLYYATTVKAIKMGQKVIMNICDMFLDIEMGIINLTLTRRPVIKTQKFDIYIENDR